MSPSTTFTLKNPPPPPVRTSFTSADIVHELWAGLDLPSPSLESLSLPGDQTSPTLPSSFKIGLLAQSSIALSALTASQVHSLRNSSSVPKVRVPLLPAAIEFKSERLYTIDGEPARSVWGALGGLHKTSDGHVRIHDNFPHHANGTLELVGLKPGATREDLAREVAKWAAIDLETAATVDGDLAAYALRSYGQWDALPQSRAVSSFPIDVNPLPVDRSHPTDDVGGGSEGFFPEWMPKGSSQCLRGLRVVELSRVIAAPLAGKTLAAHGADVLWVTSPSLPDLPVLDRDLGRGKRTIQLDIDTPEEKHRLLELIRTADVFIQGYRPGSLAARGFSQEELSKINPRIIVANMSAFGPRGPWAGRRGFDSLVQTCTGMNASEAEHAGRGEVARAMPCQALDHAGGYFLAAGVAAAVYQRGVKGGAWRVDVSLAGTMKYLRSLGQYPGRSGFEDIKDYNEQGEVPGEMLETRETGFGEMRALKHCAEVEGREVRWEVMPKALGSDKAEWL